MIIDEKYRAMGVLRIIFIRWVLPFAIVFLSASAWAAANHGGLEFNPQNGRFYEVVVEPRSVTVYITDRGGKPASTDGATGHISWKTHGSSMRVVKVDLVRIGENALRAGNIDPPLEPGEAIHVYVQPGFGFRLSERIEVPGIKLNDGTNTRLSLPKKAIRDIASAYDTDTATDPHAVGGANTVLPDSATNNSAPAPGQSPAPAMPIKVPVDANTPAQSKNVLGDKIDASDPGAPRISPSPHKSAAKPESPLRFNWLTILASIALISVNVLASLKLLDCREYSARGKLPLFFLVWLFPIAGAWIVRDLSTPARPARTPRPLEIQMPFNPFWVLEVAQRASRTDIERAGQRLLALLEIGNKGAQHYATPFGSAARTADTVRQALAELRDPVKRAVHELWAIPPHDEKNRSIQNEARIYEWAVRAPGWEC